MAFLDSSFLSGVRLPTQSAVNPDSLYIPPTQNSNFGGALSGSKLDSSGYLVPKTAADNQVSELDKVLAQLQKQQDDYDKQLASLSGGGSGGFGGGSSGTADRALTPEQQANKFIQDTIDSYTKPFLDAQSRATE